jgi:tetratricopeptide (TPR) repeat protein
MDREMVEKALRRGSYGFLEEISFSEVDPAEIHRLGPGSATAMSLVFSRLGRLDEAREMLRVEWESGEEPWRGEAGFTLAQGCLDREEYLRCLPLAEELTEEYGSYRAYRILLEARYWLLENETTLELLGEMEELFPAAAASDYELLLFEAAAGSRIGREGWRADFTRLFLTVPAGELHVRALDYLRLAGLFPEGFDSLEQDLFEMKYAFVLGQYSAGTDRARAFLAEAAGDPAEGPYGEDPSVPPGIFGDVILEDLALLFLLSGEPLEGYRSLRPLLTAAETEVPSSAVSPVKLAEVTGRLLRKAGLYREAIDRFDEGLKAAGRISSPERSEGGADLRGDPRRVDRLLWFRADCYSELGPEHLVNHLPELVTKWNSPGYFADLFEELGTAFTASGRWDLVRRTWSEVRGRGLEETTARFAYILLRNPQAWTSTAVSGDRSGGPEEDIPGEVLSREELLLEDLLRPEAGEYYPLLAGVLTGRGFDIVAPRSGSEEEPESTVPEGELSPGSARVIKLMEFGLLLEAFEVARREKAGRPVFLELGRRLEGRGLYREAILCGVEALEGLSSETPAGRIPRRDLERIYPRYFPGPVAGVVAEYPVPEPLLYALIREESYFDSRIVSRAGAVGLTQLMPSTAAEMARRLGIDEFDVLDPGTNLLFGGYYFSTLINRFPTPVHAISAYNAGPTRVRRWEGSFGNLSTDLFVEAIPFRETRNHCRKVLVSAVHYGYLYEDLEPKEVVEIFFPDLME